MMVSVKTSELLFELTASACEATMFSLLLDSVCFHGYREAV